MSVHTKIVTGELGIEPHHAKDPTSHHHFVVPPHEH
jgi:hypothetical protein